MLKYHYKNQQEQLKLVFIYFLLYTAISSIIMYIIIEILSSRKARSGNFYLTLTLSIKLCTLIIRVICKLNYPSLEERVSIFAT